MSNAYIVFRSLRSNSHTSGNSVENHTKRGLGWSYLREYQENDDMRDIAWKKIKQDNYIPVRVREDSGDFPIYVYSYTSSGDEFYIHHENESREFCIKKLLVTLKRSAFIGQYPYHEATNFPLERIKKQKIKNALIILINAPIEIHMAMLSKYNDVLSIDIYHPFEKNPNTQILFGGMLLDTKRYVATYQKSEQIRKEYIQKMGSAYLKYSTTENEIRVLNNFFKNRYKNQ